MSTHSINDSNELVSVIIPVFNGEKYLAEAIDSVLAQTYSNTEIILVDDGSTDKTRDIALSYPKLRYIFQENKGVAAARNLGIKESKGHYISFLDADDLWLPNKISLQIKILKDDPSIDVVTGHVKQFISPDADHLIRKKYVHLLKPFEGYATGAILIECNTLKKIGLFSEERRSGETVYWFSKLLEKNLNIYVLPDIVALRRIHGDNMSIKDVEEKNKQIIKILKEAIERKRSIK